jgi:uncharacterized protein YjiS (DUF1127 family)
LKAAKQLIAWISSERRARGGLAELSTLDVQLLGDIGLTPGRIDQIRRHDGLPKRWCHDDCQ